MARIFVTVAGQKKSFANYTENEQKPQIEQVNKINFKSLQWKRDRSNPSKLKKLPSIFHPMETDEEAADKDKDKKEKQYANKRRHAKTSDCVDCEGKMTANSLSTNYEPE